MKEKPKEAVANYLWYLYFNKVNIFPYCDKYIPALADVVQQMYCLHFTGKVF